MMKFQSVVKGRIFACNNEQQGVYELRAGAYTQHVGNGQTPTFRTSKSFRRYVQRMLRGE